MNSEDEKGSPVHRIGVIGVWHVHAADYVDEVLRRSDVEVAAVWDRDYEAAVDFAEPRHLLAVRTLAELLTDSSIDAVIVTTATRDHDEVITRALEAGKHVFSEKVLAILPERAAELESLAQRLGLVLLVSFQRLAESWVPSLLHVVQSGVLGIVTSSRIRYQHAGAVEGWLHDGFFSRHEAGGGAVIDLGVHGFYLSQLFHGAYPKSVTCRSSEITRRGVEDNSVVVLEYGDGAISVLETSLVSGPNDTRWVEIYGTEGVAAVDPIDGRVRVRRADSADWLEQPTLRGWPTPVQNFLSILDEGVGYERNRDESIRLVSLVAAAYESSNASRTVTVSDPVGP